MRLTPGADLAAYRVVQEALTNALRHGDGSPVTVSVRFEDGEVALEVLDGGDRAAPPPRANGGGHGLIGMRERMALYGGSLEAGPRAAGGWAVRARLPVDPGDAA